MNGQRSCCQKLAGELGTRRERAIRCCWSGTRYSARIEALFAFEVTEVYHGAVLHVMSEESEPRYMRWDKAADHLTEHIIPGDHHSIWRGNSLRTMSGLVRAVLAG